MIHHSTCPNIAKHSRTRQLTQPSGEHSHERRTSPTWTGRLLAILYLVPLLAFSMPNNPPIMFGTIGKYAPAEFYVTDVATDDSGNIYLADLHHKTVSKYAPDRSLLLKIEDPEFNWPRTITVDANGNIYVLNNTRGTIRVYSGSGQLQQVWEGFRCAGELHADIFGRILVALNGGNGCSVTGDQAVVLDQSGSELLRFGSSGRRDGQFNNPYGITDAPDGSIYIADTANNRVQKFDGNGNHLSTVGGGGTDDGKFRAPRSPATDSNGNLFVKDRRNDRIQKFDSDGKFLLLWGERGTGPGQFLESDGIEIAPDDTLWVAGYHAHDVQHFDNNGNFIERWKGHESGPGEFAEIIGIGIDNGRLFAVDHWNQRVQVFDAASGTFLNAFGERNQGEGTVFNFPRALTVGPSGDLYISDDDNVRRIQPDGTFVSLFPRLNGLRSGSFGLTVSNNGVLFQADTGNHRINKLDSATGTLLGQWGGLGAEPSQFNQPTGVAIGPDGTLYVADRGNSRVQLFTQSGDYLEEWVMNQEPRTLAIDPSRDIIYVGEWARVVAYDLDGNYLFHWGQSGNLPGEFTGIIDIALSADGSAVYVSERNNSRIQRFVYPEALLGVPAYVAGSDLGFFIWQDADDGEWHIRFSADGLAGGSAHDLSITVTASTDSLGTVRGYGLEAGDQLTSTSSRVTLTCQSELDEDGVDFFVTGTGTTELTFNIAVDGQPAPKYVFFGAQGTNPNQSTFTLPVVATAAVNQSPTINGTPPTTVAQGNDYNFTPTASDPNNDTLLFSIANKPAWAVFNPATGELSGTPGNADVRTTAGIVIAVDDQQARADSITSLPAFDLTVTNVNDHPVINSPIGNLTVTQGVAFTLDVSGNFADPDGDLLSFAANGVPSASGIGTSSDGIISGTPSQADANASPISITVTAEDPSGATSSDTFLLTVISTDSTKPGISDSEAIALGLDPNAPDGDTDNDGIADTIELGGNIDNPLDTDTDGVIDALEAGTDATNAEVTSGLPLTNGNIASITTSSGEILSQVIASTTTGEPAGINFPFGTISYTTTSPIGGNVTVRITLSTDLPENLIIYKVDNMGAYLEMPRSLWTRVDARSVDIILTDGDPLTDLDGLANGLINDPIALGDAVTVSASLDSSGTSGGGGGCVLGTETTYKDPIFPILILASLIYLIRKRLLSRLS